MSKVCDMDCLNCRYDDCINDHVYYDSASYKNRSEKAKENARRYQAELRQKAREKGLCIVCRKNIADHGVTCERCYQRNSASQRIRYEEKRRSKEYTDECRKCHEKRIPGKKLCQRCYDKAMANLKKALESPALKAHNDRFKEAESRHIKVWRAMTMNHECKFCGKEFNVAYYIGKKMYTCGECSSYCMKHCEIASCTTTSWHKEPCVSCEHNPYHMQHTWDGKEWKRNA